ncbi:MAG: AAA family ATPase, partial [Muribaculaceae bacterium]|nr:AAA family ATPase [Muribaculaceae bacterium]
MEDNSRILKEKISALISVGESVEVEFKSARGGFPGSFWESYSAYANTNGGIIILGVAEKNSQFYFDGLNKDAVTKYKKIFWDCAHNRGKVSACLPRESDVVIDNIDDCYFLICYIPRASYELRPVYIGSNPFGNTYRRNHEGDYLCTDAEVRRMFADAEHDRHSKDGQILEGFNFDRDIDKESLRQYRQTFASLQPTHPWTSISDMDFLKKIRAYAIDYATGKEGLTMAGLLMFGNYDSITNVAADPSYFVDYREKMGTDDPGVRWTHRIYPDGLWEANLYQFYVKVYNRMIQFLPRPFIIKDGIRQEETPAHDAVREALINCIVHNDISALGNIVIEQTDDKLIFRNPGMMLVSKQQYFKGGRSICRNPILQNLFMRLAGAERAGSGVDKIVGGWEYLGLPLPTVEEETRPDYV